MRSALVFNGATNLDFQEIRSNVIRIPEVIQRIREAQGIWDMVSPTPLDLANFIASENKVFLSHIKLRSFATAVVQVGLLDRCLKTQVMPEYVLGSINGDSSLKVAVGASTFFDLVAESPAINANRPRTLPLQNALDLPVLAGVQLVELALFKMQPDRQNFARTEVDAKDMDNLIVEIVDRFDVNKLIVVGPGCAVSGRKVMEITERDIQVLESIDQDPMLSWFWSQFRPDQQLIA